MTTSGWQSGTRRLQLKAWDDLKDALVRQIGRLREDGSRYFVISGPTRYVQCASLSDGTIHGEASDRDEDGQCLDPTACRGLLRLGWLKPEAPATREAGAAGNFSRRWPPTVAAAGIADLLVRTLRDIFRIASPGDLAIRKAAFSDQSAPTVKRSGQWAAPVKNRALFLPPGAIVQNAHTGRRYRVEALLGAGGFGAAYRVNQLGDSKPFSHCVLKVSVNPEGWHREAYFGELLSGEPGIVSVYETFAVVPTDRTKPLYCLVSEFAEGGDLARYLREHPAKWSEAKARREIIRLATAVKLLHSSGAVHRDITPGNVLVTPGRVLKLSDFGIASHRTGNKHVAADVFAPWFAPLPIRGRETVSWKPADDVYQLGQLFALLLLGSAASTVTPRDVRTLSCSAEAKAVIQRCIGERRRRFANAADLLAALERSNSAPARRRVVRSLSGKRVVFTGSMAILRAKAKLLVKRAGGVVENSISHSTDVVVVGERSPNWKADKKGRKLLDVDREREQGHDIAVITERRFRRIVGAV